MSKKNTNVLKIYLVGAPNCGKSTLFNRLTHAGVPVGNRAGVTVGQTRFLIAPGKLGEGCPAVEMSDLPGISSLNPSGDDEKVSCDILAKNPPDLILNVLCASSLERCLFLTASLREALPAVPMLCAINMCDELERDGIRLSTDKLGEFYQLPFFAVSAATGQGIDELRDGLCRAVKSAAADTAAGGRAVPAGVSPFPRTQAETARAAFAARAAAAALSRTPRPHAATDKADRYLTRPEFGIPLFLCIMAAIFFICFGPPGNYLTQLFQNIILTPLGALVGLICDLPGCPEVVASFLRRALLGGVGEVISFLPRIGLHFLLLSLLEDSGYLSRAAFVSDPWLRRAGLSGRAFVPLLLGFGCSVSAILSTRTLGEKRERIRCLLFLPLISCSARTPIYLSLASALLPGFGWLAILGIYLLGVIVFLLFTSTSRALSGREAPMFISELPRFRVPRPSVTLSATLRHTKEFLGRAGGVVLLTAAAVWGLSSLTPTFSVAEQPDTSLLALFAGYISPLLAPLGLSDWRAAAALIAGIGAKEGVVSTLGVLCGGSIADAGLFSPASALSFLVFSSMYIPCAASIAVMRSESGSRTKTAFAIALMLAVAYLAAFVCYRLSLLLM